ncbi:MAG: hypothetical protein DRP93_05330 [Candidatus Neomarinimicrobiota bacterium]|nr:MAG: hypothetical protein DRP93_05330 [Candidatus Neomarinimicrobiota bacterium]
MASAKDDLESKFGFFYDADAALKVNSSSEWDHDTQLLCIERYLESRRQYIQGIEDFSKSVGLSGLLEGLEEDKSFDYHITLMWLTENIGGNTKPIVEKFIQLALDDDIEVRGIGSACLRNCQHLNSTHLPAILQILDKHGSWQHPLKIGRALTSILRRFPGSYSLLSNIDHSSSDNLKQGIIASLNQEEWLPNELAEVVLILCTDPNSDVSSNALISASHKPDLKPQIVDLIYEGLHSTEWWVRGNCATACGNITPDPGRFIPALVKLTNDFEGHDWNPAECAIPSLAKYGPRAASALPAIQKALAEWGNDDEDDYFAQACRDAISSITPR